MTLFLFLASVFVFMLLSVVAIVNNKKIKYLIPLLFVSFIAITYFEFNTILGTARPVYSSFLGKLNLDNKTVTVLGGDITDEKVTLLLQDEETHAYRTYIFPYEKTFVQNLKELMTKNAIKNGGEQWGFKITFNPPKNTTKSGANLDNFGSGTSFEGVKDAQSRNELPKDEITTVQGQAEQIP